MRLVQVLLAVLAAFATAGCSSGNDAPPLDAATSANLGARAIWRACSDTVCAGAPILVESSIGEDVRRELTTFFDEILYVSADEVAAMTAIGEMFPDGATLFGAGDARVMGEPGVVGIDVSISRGRGDFLARTYLFRWDGSSWIDTSPDAVGVTVTSAVS